MFSVEFKAPPQWLYRFLVTIAVVVIGFWVGACLSAAFGHEHNVQFAEWFSSVMRPDVSEPSSCCGPADQYWALSYTASDKRGIAFDAVVQGKDGGADFPVEIPVEKVVWDRVNPTGRGVIWIGASEYGFEPAVICFVPGSGV